MDQATSGSEYTVQEGDTLSSIAQQAYGPDDRWQEIYIANTQVIGIDPNILPPGKVLYIPQIAQICTVTVADGLNVRAEANTQSALITTYPKGTVLNFVNVVYGENVAGNPRWGFSKQGHYFWLGATNRPNG